MTEHFDFGIIVQVILVIVIIIQTSHIGNTMRLNRRMNQYQLTHEWNQKLRDVYHNKSIPNINDSQVYENEYQNLIFIFQDMHGLFKDKLLKSADFFTMFMRLHLLTKIEAENKSSVFHKNHITLQVIYDDFNNIDVGVKLFDYVDNDIMDELTKTVNENSVKGIGLKNIKTNYPKYHKWLRLGLWISLKIKKEPYFKLPSIK